MNVQNLLNYLQDIIKIETEVKIAQNTFHELSIKQKECKNKIISNEEPGKLVSVNEKELFQRLLGLGIVVIFYGLFHNILEIFLPEIGIYIIFAVVIGIIVSVTIYISGKARFREFEKKCDKIDRNNQQLIQAIENSKPALQRILTECVKTRNELYSLNIIHPNYRSLEACTMFYEYLSTGRTHSLTATSGDPGAYNIYVDELYKKKIVDKLDKIDKKMDEMLNNQKMLYQIASEIDTKVNELCFSVYNIEKNVQQIMQNTNISAWSNAVTATNTYTLKRIQEGYYF